MASPMDFYAFREKAIQQGGQVRDAQSMAEMGAARLEQYGPQGAEWASRLRADPRAALAMAQQYGGFQQIEQGLRYANANARAATADDLARIALETGSGPQGFAQIGAGAAGLQRTSNAPGLGEVFKLRKEIGDRSKGFGVQRDYMSRAAAAAAKAAETNDSKARGAADFVLIQSMGKMIDPNSVVRNEEGKLIQESGSSEVGKFLQQWSRMFGSTGILDPQARLMLMQQIESAYGSAVAEQAATIEGFRNEMRRNLPENLIDLTLPDYADPSELKPIGFDYSPWQKAANATGAPDSPTPNIEATREAMTSAKAGDKVRDHLGRVWVKLEDGTFDPVEVP